MHGYGQGIGKYQRTQIVTADPGKLVILCYEGAISHLRRARNHYQVNEFEAKARAVQKTIDILSELVQSLDFQKGGEIAKNLDALYSYMIRRIMEGDINKDLKAFDEVIGLLEEMEGAWKKICNGTPVVQEQPNKSKAAINAWRA